MSLHTEYKPLSEIQVADKNPKDHNIGEIYSSIKRWGFVEIPVVNEATGKLVAGHGRLETLKLLKKEGFVPEGIKVDDNGEWLIPVQRGISFKSDAEAEAYLVASNRLVELGGWKQDELVELLENVAIETEDMSGVGFDLADIQNILEDMEGRIFEEEEIPDEDEETTVRFKFGRYKFGVDAEYFYEWEAKQLEELGTNNPQALVNRIKELLGL